MKIEYIPDGSTDSPLILIHGSDVGAIISFRHAGLNAEDEDSWGSVIFDEARPIGGIWPGVGGLFGEKAGRDTGERDCPVFQAGADDGELGCEEDRNPPSER